MGLNSKVFGHGSDALTKMVTFPKRTIKMMVSELFLQGFTSNGSMDCKI